MQKHIRNPKILLIGVVVIAVLLGAVVWSWRTFHKNVAVSGVIPTISSSTTTQTSTPSSQNSDKSVNSPSASTQPSDKSSTTTPTQSVGGDPVKPYGTFVSNHSPSLSGKDVPSSVQSVCSGKPGAKCYISFTLGDVVKTLPEQTIGSDGSTTWDWDVKKAGFTTGSWTIKAISSLNGKTAETSDTIKFEVQE